MYPVPYKTTLIFFPNQCGILQIFLMFIVTFHWSHLEFQCQKCYQCCLKNLFLMTGWRGKKAGKRLNGYDVTTNKTLNELSEQMYKLFTFCSLGFIYIKLFVWINFMKDRRPMSLRDAKKYGLDYLCGIYNVNLFTTSPIPSLKLI